MAPIFDKVSQCDEFKDIEFKSLDIENDDEGIEMVEQFQIKSIPTIIILGHEDEVLKKIIGTLEENNLISLIKEVINK
jgi:thiol-disulfide isomerase/thioredoxin